MNASTGNLLKNSKFLYLSSFVFLTVAFSLLSTWPKGNSVYYVLLWIGLSALYPFCLTLAHARTGYWKGLSILLLQLTFAQSIAFLTTLARNHGLLRRSYIALHLFYGDLIESAVLAVVCFTVGYFSSRWMMKYRPAEEQEE
jgi:hypothetical protein